MYANTYFPLKVDRTPGDASPFLQLLQKILPDEHDRTILLSYLAACVQHVGTKFQWAPLLQGAEGNGKTFLATAVAQAIGERYSHFPNVLDMGGNGLKFTGWMEGKLFICIEEIFISENVDLSEDLNPYITNLRIEFQHKGAGQHMGDNRANYLLLSNHKDGIRKTRKGRLILNCSTAAIARLPGSSVSETVTWAPQGTHPPRSTLMRPFARSGISAPTGQ